MIRLILLACCATLAALGIAACDVNARPEGASPSPIIIYGEAPKDGGVSSRCAAIVNPAERRKCIQSSGG